MDRRPPSASAYKRAAGSAEPICALSLQTVSHSPASSNSSRGCRLGLVEADVGIDRDGVGVDVKAYRTCQQSRALRAGEHSPRWNEHQLVGAIPHARDRQPFDEGLGVIANALLDSDEQVVLLFETIFEGLMVDDLHGLGAHATPACGPVSDSVGRKEINRRHSAVDRVGCGHLVRGSAFNCGGAVHAITSSLSILLLSSRHLLIRNSSPT